MARNIRKGQVMMVSEELASGITDNTITMQQVVVPEVGARIAKWGVRTTIAGTGALDPVLSLAERGQTYSTGEYGTRLANDITLNLDAAANTVNTAIGPAIEVGSNGKAATLGEAVDVHVQFTAAEDTFATTNTSFRVWTLWHM